MHNVKSILLSLNEKTLEAAKNADAKFHEDYLHDSVIAILPFGIVGKRAVVEQLGSANSPFRSSKTDDTRVIVLSSMSGFVTYKATYTTPDHKTFEVVVTTVYAKIGGLWKGVLYQQTPIHL